MNKPQKQHHPKKTSTQIYASRQTFYSGQLPPPEMLEHFEQIHPGFTDRLLTMVEKESDFKRDHDKKSLSTFKWSTFLGMAFALLAVIAVCGVSVYCIYMGDARSAAWIMASSCAAVIVAFLQRRKRNRGE